jgi:hypothetical protein
MAQATMQNVQECIQACQACHRICLEEATHHCLEAGGKHVQPEHYRLMLSCAEICQTAANFMIGGSVHHRETCHACAIVCEACAEDCQRVGDMERCAEACRNCANLCREMAA